MFIALGLSGLIPAVHYIITFGSYKAFNVGGLGWLILMAAFYITGACLYAARIPERLFPGKFDIWVRSLFLVYIITLELYLEYIHFFLIVSKSSNFSCVRGRGRLHSLSWRYQIS